MADEFEDFEVLFSVITTKKRVATSLCSSETTFGEGSQLFDLGQADESLNRATSLVGLK